MLRSLGYDTNRYIPVVTTSNVTISGQAIGVNGMPASYYPMRSAVNGQSQAQSSTDAFGNYAVTKVRGATIMVASNTTQGVTSESPRHMFSNIQADQPSRNFQLKQGKEIDGRCTQMKNLGPFA